MPVHLVLRLMAPFASAGTVAGEETRPTAEVPTRSMVLGLIGNAMGFDRTCEADMERLNRLQAATQFSAIILSTSGLWVDVQNNRVPSASLKRTHFKPKELSQPGDVTDRLLAGGRISDHPLAYGIGDKKEAENVRDLLHKASRQRSKQYLTGLHALVALSPHSNWPEPPERLVAALRQPARSLWIGRKNCPPSAPICLLQPLDLLRK
jgi:CRISPR system Cascade subunit CasD